MMEMAGVGVQTRAKALAVATATAAATRGGKRKVNNNDHNQRLVMHIEFTRRKRRVLISSTPENSVSTSPELLNPGQRSNVEEKEDRYTNPRLIEELSESDQASGSCCSSNGSIEDHERINKFADLLQNERSVEVETSVNYGCRERETTPSSKFREESSVELDSPARQPVNSRRRLSTARMMPTESELEDFFAEAEKNIQKQFADKYNYDIVKDEPLKGRLEWVRLKP
ncbi:cyclin-dependent kinase inhibitor 7-like [Mercurialis annua]|uniref:cyclin-dependent kinase inhibitor 7-like n=1 Tax=Mercurialis annua TaxID=3986 RepID=UPI002160785D|nr:cyclin-dependent kinase inhibitor 7-like [Mercurialis annua]